MSDENKKLWDIKSLCDLFIAMSRGKTHASQPEIPEQHLEDPIPLPPWRVSKLVDDAEAAGLVGRKTLVKQFLFVQNEQIFLSKGIAGHHVSMPLVHEILFHVESRLRLNNVLR